MRDLSRMLRQFGIYGCIRQCLTTTLTVATSAFAADASNGGKRMLMHLIEAEAFIRAFSWSSRLNGDWDFLQHLYDMGRA